MYGRIYVRCAGCGLESGINTDLLDADTRERLIAVTTAATLAGSGNSSGAPILPPELSELPGLRCTYPSCAAPAPQMWRYRYRNAQVGVSEAAAVAIHPQTGEAVYCFANPSDPLPERYARGGFVKHQFHSLSSLRAFCNARGLVNDIEYDSPHEGMTEESIRTREEWERTRNSAYERERELAARALADERPSRKRHR